MRFVPEVDIISSMELIRSFERLSKGDASIAGGKGASLGEMTQAGISVPPGFVVLAPAFERFLAEADLNQELDTIFHTVNHQEMRTVDLASEKIRQLITSAKMSEDIAGAIQAEFEKLGAEFVAVRSSATAEDSTSAAWAGQLETYLNTTQDDLLENVQKCWASLFTPRAIFYRFEKGMHGSKISVAVVVQKMIQSEVSGIAFSVHPVTEDYNQMIIEAGFGLGEAIVSGQVTPDSYILEKTPRRIIDKNITYQNRALWRGKSGGNEWRELSEEEGSKPALSNEQALYLADLVLNIEQHYGFPCDIEWAYEAGQFYITQSRPITTLAKKSENPEHYFRSLKFFKKGRWATHPLDTEMWHNEHTSQAFEEWFGIWREILPVCVLRGDAYDDNHMYTPVSFVEHLHARIREINSADPKGLGRILMQFYEDKRATKQDLPKQSIGNPSILSSAELAEAYLRLRMLQHRAVICDQFTWLAEDYWPPLINKVLVEKHGLEEGSPGYNDALFALIKPREISTTLEEKREIIEEALQVDVGKQTIQKAAKKLAASYGWMPILAFGVPWDAGQYAQEVEESLAKDKQLLRNELTELRRYSERRDEDFNTVVQRLGVSPEDAELFTEYGLAIDARNEAEYVASFIGGFLMPVLDEIRKRLDITLPELRALFEGEIAAGLKGEADVKSILASKKRVIAWGITPMKTRVNFSPELAEEVFAQAEAQNASPSVQDDVRRGVTANKGKVRGTVRLVPTPEDNHKVSQGDILFAYSTMVDNLPAMKKAAAFVTESGGLTCHAAVVAREFGVPCIVSYKNAMSDFKDGDMVEVDADSGIVRRL